MTTTAPSISGIFVHEPELLAATGYEHRGHLERWLRENRVPYFRGRRGALFTTTRLLESAKLPQADGPASAPAIEF